MNAPQTTIAMTGLATVIPGCRRWWARWTTEARLQQVFKVLLFLRFYYPFYSSPMDRLFSDPARHWDNAQRFWQPSIMGSSDPFLYQLWLHVLQWLSGDNRAVVEAGSGLLCVLMPWGWYRALRELLPQRRALMGGILIGCVPVFLNAYAYFMNETLLMSLTGVAFWLTFRSHRKRSIGAFALAAAAWTLAIFTRSLLMPVAAACLGWLWIGQRRRFAKVLVSLPLFFALLIPAGWHSQQALHYFTPFGGLYLNEIYRASGMKVIQIDLGPQGQYGFGCPSFYNQTFYPFSDWMGDRDGTVSIAIDTSRGRADWIAELKRVAPLSPRSVWADYRENWAYLFFGQSWPQNDLGSPLGWLSVWTRWLWPVLIAWVLVLALRRRFQGAAWLLPVCGIGAVLLLALQREAIIEGRYRMPLDPIFIAAALVATRPARDAGTQGGNHHDHAPDRLADGMALGTTGTAGPGEGLQPGA